MLAPTPVPSGMAPVTNRAVGRSKWDCNRQKVGCGNYLCKQFAIALMRQVSRSGEPLSAVAVRAGRCSGGNKLPACARGEVAVEHPGNREPVILRIGIPAHSRIGSGIHGSFGRGETVNGKMPQRLGQKRVEGDRFCHTICPEPPVVIGRPRQRWSQQSAPRSAPSETADRVIGRSKANRHEARHFPLSSPRHQVRGVPERSSDPPLRLGVITGLRTA